MSATTTQAPVRSAAMLPRIAPAQQVARTNGRPASGPPPEASLPDVGVGFDNLRSWEFTQRVARGLASSTLVPEQYRLRIRDKKARDEVWLENQAAIPNCIIALNMAKRMRADPLMVMQNLYIVEGRPSWSAQFVISAINSCGRFTTLKFRTTKGEEEEVEYIVSGWRNRDDGSGKRERYEEVKKTKLRHQSWVAYAKDRETGEIIESPEISMKMALIEGWYAKPGSKWQTMPEIMGPYRAASFFGRLNCPDVLMGLRSDDEEREIIEAQRNSIGDWEVEPEPGRIHQDISDVEGIADGEQQAAEADVASQDEAQSSDQPAEQHVTTVHPDALETVDRQTGEVRMETAQETLERLATEGEEKGKTARIQAEAMEYERQQRSQKTRARTQQTHGDDLPLDGGR